MTKCYRSITAWAALGQVQMKQGKFGAAFTSTQRALDFDRDNPALLRTMAELAIRSDNIELAEQYSEKLDIVSPRDPISLLVKGIVELRRRDFAAADKYAEELMTGPAASDGRILKSQVLLRTGKEEEAIDLLNEQLTATPTDAFTMHALALIHERQDNWTEVAKYRRLLWEADNENFGKAVQYVRAALRAKQIGEASAVSRKVMTPGAPPWLLEAMLSSWEGHWPGTARVMLAKELARKSGGPQRLAYAQFLNRIGAPADALPLISGLTDTGSDAFNLRIKASMALSLVALRQYDRASELIDEVLDDEADNVEALRARAKLRAASGQYDLAIYDARKVVSLEPDSPADRHAMADIYLAAGKPRDATRVLWDGFQTIKSDRTIYQRLRKSMLAAKEDVGMLDHQYQEQIDSALARDLLT